MDDSPDKIPQEPVPRNATPPGAAHDLTRPRRLAVSMPFGEDIPHFIRHTKWAEDAGFDSVWLGDVGGIDALTMAGALCKHTSRIRIGTSVVPLFPRTPAVFASTAYTLHQLSKGRFILGLGVSSQTMMSEWHGLPFERPRTRIREAALLLRQMFAGEKTDFTGSTINSRGYRLPDGSAANLPIYLAALRGRMLETAGEVADGVILNRFPLSVVPRLVEHVHEGARQAGRQPGSVDIAAHLKMCVTDDPHRALEGVRQRFAGYYSTPVYNKYLAWCGFEEQAAALAEGWRQHDRRRTLGVMNDELLSQFVIAGSVEQCHAAARALLNSGVTTLIVGAYTPDLDVQRATFEAFTPERFTLN